MDTDVMIRQLRALAEKHKKDNVFTFDVNWADVCRDVANRLEEQEQKISELTRVISSLKQPSSN